MINLIYFLIGLVLGTWFGFVLGGVFAMEDDDETMLDK